jgi:hypothetical protein
MARFESVYVESEMPKSDRNFDPLPPGWYDVCITEGEIKATKAGTGQYLKLRYDVEGPSHQGRCVFGNLNLRNPNPEAERIGSQQMGELLRAVGLPEAKDSDQFIGKRLSVKLAVKESEQYGASNEVKAFKANGSVQAAAPAGAPKPAASKPPWAK